jgi:hypothetical protein
MVPLHADLTTTLARSCPTIHRTALSRTIAPLAFLPFQQTGGNFNIPGPMIPDWKLENILPELTKHAVRWIEDKAQAKKPFFLYFALTSPHYPVVPAPEFVGKTEGSVPMAISFTKPIGASVRYSMRSIELESREHSGYFHK